MRMHYLLNCIDRFGIPVAKNKMEDGFQAILAGVIRARYEAYKNNPARSAEEGEQLLRLLDFAGRMNFNTNDFPLQFS